MDLATVFEDDRYGKDEEDIRQKGDIHQQETVRLMVGNLNGLSVSVCWLNFPSLSVINYD